MKSFLSVLASYVLAGAFCVVAVNSATFQSNSGTQPYNRVIR